MANLYLVRHGDAVTTWEPSDFDPGLSELGRAQAEARAEQLAGKGPLALLSSPLRRARDTAATLERRWKTVATIDPRIGEIQAPGIAPEHRREWLKGVLQHRWCELGEPLERWRTDVLQALWGITQDTRRIHTFRGDQCSGGACSGKRFYDQLSSRKLLMHPP